MLKRTLFIALWLATAAARAAAITNAMPDSLTRHLSLTDCIDLALRQNSAMLDQAEEALRPADACAETGTGTRLDVLSAETAFTEARPTQVQALRDYAVARARRESATDRPATMSVAVERGCSSILRCRW